MFLSFIHTLRGLLDALLDFVYPPLCICCGRLLETGKVQVCPECWSSIKRVSHDLPLFNETKGNLVASGEIDELVSLFVFEKEGAFQKIAHALKYSGVQRLGVELGRRLGAQIQTEGLSVDMVVPVPLHRRKMRERGFNQAALIGRGVADVLQVPLRSDLMLRTKWTETQTTLSKEERKENVESAFRCMPGATDHLVVLVVDDVITTGATIEAVAMALKSSGAKTIIAAAAALAQ